MQTKVALRYVSICWNSGLIYGPIEVGVTEDGTEDCEENKEASHFVGLCVWLLKCAPAALFILFATSPFSAATRSHDEILILPIAGQA